MSKKNLTKYKILTVFCKCGQKLVKYKKGGKGRLIKIHKDRISEDYSGVFINDYSGENSDIYCPNCSSRLATVKCIGGKYVNKLNQGSIGNIKK